MKRDQVVVRHSTEMLKRLLREGVTVYGISDKSSPNGRWMIVLCVHGRKIRDITRYAAAACGMRLSRNNTKLFVAGTGHCHIQTLAEELTRVTGYELEHQWLGGV